MQININYNRVYIQDCNANNYSLGGVENVGQSPYFHAPVHPAVNGYWILVWGGDLAPASARCARVPIQKLYGQSQQYSMGSVQDLCT